MDIKALQNPYVNKLKRDRDINVHVIDGFSLGGSGLSNIGKFYGPITRKSEKLWEMVFHFSSDYPAFINTFYRSSHKK